MKCKGVDKVQTSENLTFCAMVWRMVFLLGAERANDLAILLYIQDYLAKAGVGKIFVSVCILRLSVLPSLSLSLSRSFHQMAWA
jgi:hypothetical protein